MDAVTEITIFVLAALVGFEVISKVPATLHTPLMSQTNAIHGIVLLGGLLVIGFADNPLEDAIGVLLADSPEARVLARATVISDTVVGEAEVRSLVVDVDGQEAATPIAALEIENGDVARASEILVGFKRHLAGPGLDVEVPLRGVAPHIRQELWPGRREVFVLDDSALETEHGDRRVTPGA